MNINNDDIYYYENGPKVFSISNKLYYFFEVCSENENIWRYTVTKIDQSQIEQLSKKIFDLHALLKNKKSNIVEIDINVIKIIK